MHWQIYCLCSIRSYKSNMITAGCGGAFFWSNSRRDFFLLLVFCFSWVHESLVIRISEPGLVLNLWLFHDASPHLQYILLRLCMPDQYLCEMLIHVSVFGATFMHLVVCNYSVCTRPTVYTYQYCLLWLSNYWWCSDCVLFTHLHLLNLASKAPQKTNNPLNPYLFYMYVLLADILTCSFLWINRGGSKLAEANLLGKKGSLKVSPASSSLHFAHQQYWSIDR